MKFKLEIILVFLFILGSQGNARRFQEGDCEHGLLEEDTELMEVRDFVTHTRETRFLANTIGKFKIHVDYSQLMTSQIPQWTKYYIKNYLVPRVVRYLTKRLSVLKRTSKLILPSYVRKCGVLVNVPYEHRNVGVEADYILYIAGESSPLNYIVKGGSCLFDPLNGNRPIAGRLDWNANHITKEWSLAKNYLRLGIHSLIHTLVFSSSLFPYYVDKSGVPLGKDNILIKVDKKIMGRPAHNWIITPKVKEAAIKHFGCKSMEGMPLDSGLPGGAHWFRPLIEPAFMANGKSDQYSVITEFTMALFEDSGWYIPNYNFNEFVNWGKNKGCDFVYNLCNNEDHKFNEFCYETNKIGCDHDHHAISECKSPSSMAGCSYNQAKNICNTEKVVENKDSGFRFGDNSKCIETDKLAIWYHLGESNDKANCFYSSCVEKNKPVIRVGDRNVNCEHKGQRITPPGYKGQIICPDPVEFCFDYIKECRNSCHYNGLCDKATHKCHCHIGYTGEYCDKQVRPEYSMSFIMKMLKNSYFKEKGKSGFRRLPFRWTKGRN